MLEFNKINLMFSRSTLDLIKFYFTYSNTGSQICGHANSRMIKFKKDMRINLDTWITTVQFYFLFKFLDQILLKFQLKFQETYTDLLTVIIS